ncbi:MAG: translocation/assembly module TamB domain-containing protein [Bryobacteraceae bacterium]|nr:translocation/assembly module TamB domain-containing protein [Bryobacteraceae bacterium]
MSTTPPPAPPPPEPPPRPGRVTRTARVLLWILATLIGLVLLLGLAAVIILPSSWFREKVRDRIVTEVEKATGGRVEIGSFRFDWSSITAEIAPFILHGTEPAAEAPLFRAESVKVELKIISMLKRDIDIASLLVEQPRVNFLMDASGITNIPKPKVEKKSGKDPIQQILDLAIKEINLRNGEIHYGDRKLPLDVRGRYVNAKLFYDLNGPAYNGTLAIAEATVSGQTPLPVNFGVNSKFRLLKNRVELQEARVALKESSVQLSGVVEDLNNPRVTADVTANAFMSELGPLLKLPQPHVGQATFRGKVLYDPVNNLRVNGRLTGQHFAMRQGSINLRNVSVAADVDFQNRDVRLRGLTVHALDGVFSGAVDLLNFKTYKVNGALTGVSIPSVMRTAGLKRADFAGTLSGPVEITGSLAAGSKDLKAGAKIKIAARQGAVPVKGFLEVAYTQRRNTIQLGNSWVELPHTRLDLRGTVGEQLTVRLDSRDLEDFKPALALASDNVPERFPILLVRGGSAVFDGTITGPLDKARAAGQLTLTSFEVAEQSVDRLVATVDATPSGAHVSTFALAQGTLRLSGSADVGLQQWKPADSSPLTATVKVEGAQLATLLKQAKQDVPVEGLASAEANVTGTVGAPQANLRVNVEKPVIYGEKFDRFTAELKYAGTGIEVLNGVMTAGDNRILLTGTYSHPQEDLKNGTLNFNVSTEGWSLQEVQYLEKQRPGLAGRVRIKLAGNVAVKNAEMLPQSVDGQVSIGGLSVDKRPIGDVTLDARTAGQQLTLSVNGNLRGSVITGKGGFQLAGDYPGSGELTVAPIQFSTLQDLVMTSQSRQPLPVEGTIEARATFSGPAKKPEAMRARVEIPTLNIVPVRRSLTSRQKSELSFRNEGPIVLEYDGKAVNVRSAHLVGPETDLKASGAILVREKSVADVKIDGSLNLAILQSFDPNIVSSGATTVSASVRGSLQDPQFGGRMEFKNASFYMTDFPNGIDNLNGTILFDQRRATIESLRANTGGGDLLLSGFVGLGRDEMTYRLQARADRVRLRYPEGVSATANATLSLTGTTSNSLLSGVVTLTRAGFNPKSDVGGLLASAPTPVAAPVTKNEYLRNMNLDIRVETVPNLQFQTSLTANIQADADLRIKGTAAKPAVLGRVVVSQGEAEFFGNKYTITRGEISFFNPIRIEPVLDFNVETKARGVDVSISLSGTTKKLNFSYRSDPPLQTNEIIALLAMGRAPGSNSSLASSQTVSNSNVLATGTNSLLGQAVNPVSDRLQRFFGVSRLKIDPQLTGLSAVPQARLTIEQQVSRDITLTYVTNLAQANQQIIRLEWNLNPTWSVVAVREENGLFGVDFFFKKRVR